MQQREPSLILLWNKYQQSCYHPVSNHRTKGKNNLPRFRAQNDSLLLDGGTDGIAIPSIERAQNPPVYYGTLEIKKTAQGLLIANELSWAYLGSCNSQVKYLHPMKEQAWPRQYAARPTLQFARYEAVWEKMPGTDRK
ncbi:MAG: hypothetical protein ACLRZ5_08225 [Ruminococcus sp.]